MLKNQYFDTAKYPLKNRLFRAAIVYFACFDRIVPKNLRGEDKCRIPYFCPPHSLCSKQPSRCQCRGKIVYMNPAAVNFAGADLTSKPVDMLMPSHISNNQADSFVTTALIGSKSCTVKVSSANGYRIHVISCDGFPSSPSDSVFDTLRSCMSNIKFSASCMSVIAETLQTTSSANTSARSTATITA